MTTLALHAASGNFWDNGNIGTFLQKITPTTTMYLDEIQVHKSANSSISRNDFAGRVYSSNADGSVGARLVAGGTVQSGTAVADQYVRLPISPFLLQAGVTYWIGWYGSAAFASQVIGNTGGDPHAHTADGLSLSVSLFKYSYGSEAPPSSNSSREIDLKFVVRSPNAAPNAPTLTTMHDGSVVDRGAANRASHTFSDPDAGDSQSKFDHRYRLVGSSTWTEATETTPNPFVDYPAGTFPAGDYERQVRTYDAIGVVGPWSASGFFTAATAPQAPSITAPINGAIVSAEAANVTWSTPDQDAYQLQVLDGGLVLYDTGVVESAATRTVSEVPFPDNNAARTIRVRIRHGGLWSTWTTVTVTVSYTPPSAPVVTLTPSGYALAVQVTNPAPASGEPVVTHNRVYVDDLQAEGETLRVSALPANGTWTYRLPRSGVDYDGLVRVVAVGDNGTTRSSA